MKRTKIRPNKTLKITAKDAEQMEAIYKIRAQFAQSVYLTPIGGPKSTIVRLVFTEHNSALHKSHPTHAIAMMLEDFQRLYEAMTTFLETMRQAGRIE